MKNFILSILGIAILAAVLEQFLPWWSIAIAGFALGYAIRQHWLVALSAGFIAIFFLWAFYGYALSSANHHLLATRVATLMPFKGHVTWLLVFTGFLGGVVGAFSTLTGNLAARLTTN